MNGFCGASFQHKYQERAEFVLETPSPALGMSPS